MGAYTDKDHVSLVGLLNREEIEEVEARFPGFIDGNAESVSRIIDALLRKRYVVPLADPVPESVRFHAAQLLAQRIWRRHGDSPTNQAKTDEVNQAAADAMAWFREAATAQTGLIEIPFRDDGDDAAIAKVEPLSCSQPSAYDWIDVQAQAINDGNATGGR